MLKYFRVILVVLVLFMNFFDLTSAVDKRIGSTPPCLWTIGATSDYVKIREDLISEHEDCKCWSDWEADNEKIALSVVEHFRNNGLRYKPNGEANSKYVYLF